MRVFNLTVVTAREIVQVCAKDFTTALYVGVDDGSRYLVGTDHLRPDCTTPIIVLDESDGRIGSMRGYHDVGCPVAHLTGGSTLSASDRSRVTETRRKYLGEALELWSELA